MGSQAIMPVALLILSNVFMTFAWYGHLKFKHLPIWTVVLASWGNPILVFISFAGLYLGERVRSNELAAFGLILAAVVVATRPGGR